MASHKSKRNLTPGTPSKKYGGEKKGIGDGREVELKKSTTKRSGVAEKIDLAKLLELDLQEPRQDESMLHGVTVKNIVKDMPKDFGKPFLIEGFEKHYGPVVKAHFPADKKTGHLVGHGVVYFRDKKSAEKAVQEPFSISGQPLKLEYVRSTKKKEKHTGAPAPATPAPASLFEITKSKSVQPLEPEPFNNLYVKNIAGVFKNDQQFLKLFERYGPVTSHKIVKDVHGAWRGFAFVYFENSDDAKQAMKELDHLKLPNGLKLHVSKYKSKGNQGGRAEKKFYASRVVTPTVKTTSRPMKKPVPRASTPSAASISELSKKTKNLKLSIPEDSDEDDIQLEDQDGNGNSEDDHDAESGEGELERTTSETEDTTGTDASSSSSKEETDHESISSSHAASISSKSKSKAKTSTAKKFSTKTKPEKNFTNLYVKNFSGMINTDEDLEGAFKIFGPILSVKVRGPDFGYVCFKSSKYAQAAMDALDGKKIGNGRVLQIARALTKEERGKGNGKEKDKNQDPDMSYERNEFEPEFLYAGSNARAMPIPQGDPSCTICSKSNKKLQKVILGCQHIYCTPCLKTWLTLCIENEELDSIHCQHRDDGGENGECEEKFGYSLVKQLVSKKTFVQYDKLLLYNLLETLDDIVKCPKCECPTPIHEDCPEALGTCRKCGWSFLPETAAAAAESDSADE